MSTNVLVIALMMHYLDIERDGAEAREADEIHVLMWCVEKETENQADGQSEEPTWHQLHTMHSPSFTAEVVRSF